MIQTFLALFGMDLVMFHSPQYTSTYVNPTRKRVKDIFQKSKYNTEFSQTTQNQIIVKGENIKRKGRAYI